MRPCHYFETPTAVASIRGTVVGFTVTGDRTQIKVYEGHVLVVPAGAKEGAEIKENQMATVARGQKTVNVEKLVEKTPAGIMEPQKAPADTAKKPPVDSSKLKKTDSSGLLQGKAAPRDTSGETTARRDTTRTPRTLKLSVSTPADGQQFSKTLIPVSGSASAGAEVIVTPPGVRIMVSSSGSFSTQSPIPDEDGDQVIEVEASLDGKTQKVSRHIIYHPEFRFTLTTPGDRQTVSSTILSVKGNVQPAKGAEITALGRKLSVAPDGTFAGVISIPDEEGEVQLDFEVAVGGSQHTVTRTVVYKKAADTYAPVIQSALPKVARQRQLCLPVYDRTADDEITFYWEIDGTRDSEKGTGNGSFCFNLEPGIHLYAVYAEDRSKNQSQRLSERIAWLETSVWNIRMRKPAGEETLRLPPSPPEDNFSPTYTVSFSIENLPGDDMNLIREVTVTNQATGETSKRSTFTDHYLEFEMKLKQGRTNMIVVEVQDINGNRKTQQAPINLK